MLVVVEALEVLAEVLAVEVLELPPSAPAPSVPAVVPEVAPPTPAVEPVVPPVPELPVVAPVVVVALLAAASEEVAVDALALGAELVEVTVEAVAEVALTLLPLLLAEAPPLVLAAVSVDRLLSAGLPVSASVLALQAVRQAASHETASESSVRAE